jgi:hypothetical protein
VALFGARCPVPERERVWIEESLSWLAEQFGPAVCRPVVLPTGDFFPTPYRGVEDVRAVVERVCGYVGVEAARIEVEFIDDGGAAQMLEHLPLAGYQRGVAGEWYQGRDGTGTVVVSEAAARDPLQLIAVIAHELGHQRLLGEGRIDADRADHEPLTDLAAVHFGMGIFVANAAFEFTQGRAGWRRQTLGYLTEPMYGYALARHTRARGDDQPAWARYLDTNPRAYLKQSMKYLRANG